MSEAKALPIYNFHRDEQSQQKWYQNAAVASDSVKVSQICMDILRKGGSTVDAGIAALLCNGVLDQMHMGIGGGCIMLIYEHPKDGGPKEMVSLDGDCRIPLWMGNCEDIDNTNENKVLVPGELAGYKWAWERYGRLPWSEIVEPSAKLASKGFEVIKTFENTCREFWESKIMKYESLAFFRKKHLESNEFEPYSEGDILIDAKLGETLNIVAKEGAGAFYTGLLSELILEDMAEHNIKITREDLQSFEVRKLETIKIPVKNGEYFIHAPGDPFYGYVFAFLFQVMESFDIKKEDLLTDEGIALFYHRFMEAWKFFVSFRSYIGDSYKDLDKHEEVHAKLLSKEYAAEVSKLIKNDSILPEDEYNLLGGITSADNDHGTSHISILAADGSAFSASSTICMQFGSCVKGTKTGIVFNDRLRCFNQDKSIKTAYDVKPGAGGYSHRCPIIVTDKDGDAIIVLGSSGGARIVQTLTLTVILHLLYDLDLQQSIDYPKVAQLGKKFHFTDFVHDFSHKETKIVQKLKNIGHNIKHHADLHKAYVAVVQGISKKMCKCADKKCTKTCIEAVSDYRKGGEADGY